MKSAATERTASTDGLYAVLLKMHRMFKVPAQGLSATALATLAAVSKTDGVKVTDLAAEQGVAQPTMTVLVNRFEKAGLAVRRADESDARSTLVHLTDEGDALLQERRNEIHQMLRSALDGLTDTDRAAVEAALPALERLADATQRARKKEDR